MAWAELFSPSPMDAFPHWAAWNKIDLGPVELRATKDRGCGLFVKQSFGSEDGPVTLFTVPWDVVLSEATVLDLAKADASFRELRDEVKPSVRPSSLAFDLGPLPGVCPHLTAIDH
jgi:hypothetical protein